MSDYFTTDELAEFLRVKPRKVYDLVAKEEVPFSRVMGKLLFSKEIEKPMLDILLDIDKKFSKNSLLKLKKRKKIALIIIK